MQTLEDRLYHETPTCANGTKLSRHQGAKSTRWKHEDHCGLHVWAHRELGAIGSNADGATGKVEGRLPGEEGEGEMPFWTY